jgi:hypothetical protein
MNEEARAELDRILAMEPAALTEGDQAFLAARASYLTEEQRIRHGLVDATEMPSPRRSRKASDE